MTLREASERFRISIEILTDYEQNGLIEPEALVNDVPDYSEEELRKVGVIHALLAAGMDVNELRKYLQLLRRKMDSKDEQIRILRKQRYKLLDEIHCKQRALDELDYMIAKIKKSGGLEE